MTGVVHYVFESEEVNWLVSGAGLLQPVVVPPVPCVDAVFLELLPVNPNGILRQLLKCSSDMSLSKYQIEKWWCDVHWVSRAYHSDFRFEPFLKHKLEGVVGLPDPTSVIYYSLSLEAACLQSHIWRMLKNHIRASSYSRNIFKVLSHETISAARIGWIHDRTLLNSLLVCKASLLAKEVVLNLVVSSNVLWTEQSQQLIHVDGNIAHVLNNALILQCVSRKSLLDNFLKGKVAFVDPAHRKPTKFLVAVELTQFSQGGKDRFEDILIEELVGKFKAKKSSSYNNQEASLWVWWILFLLKFIESLQN